MTLKYFPVTFIIALLALGSPLYAETPAERVAKIKEWRANCNDPDPDFRIAYLEAAIESNDQTILRTCLQQTINSDNTDVKNLALRTALASSKQLALIISMPESYNSAMSKAGNDTNKKASIQREFRDDFEVVTRSGGLLGLSPIKVSIGSALSNWYVLGQNTQTDERYATQLVITGDTISGNGQAYFSGSVYNFNMQLTLNNKAELEGEIKIHQSSQLPVKIKLL